MADTTLEYGWIEELWLMGASKKTICKMTKLPADDVDRIIHQIEKNRNTLRGFKVEKEAQ